jgi:hypothetical protein
MQKPGDDEPKIRPAKPKDAAPVGAKPGNMIPGGGKPIPAAPGHKPDPTKFWADYFDKHDEMPGQLLETVVDLKQAGKLDDVEAAIKGYLRRFTKRSEYWMYEMLAVAVEVRKGPADEIKLYLGYASYKALQNKNPNQLLSVADMLYRRGIFDKVGPPNNQTTVGELIDLSAKQVPHRIEPLMMSVNLALKTKDPKRMADAVDQMLSLGWPGGDETVRREARKQVDDLAKLLREDDRSEEAAALLARLPQAMARDVYIALRWEGIDDLDLIVEEPLGATAQLFKNPRTVFGGAIVTNGFGKHPEEVYVCPRGFSGPYTIRVDKIFQPANPVKVATLEIVTHEGTPEEKRIFRKIDLAKPEPVVIRLDDGRRKDVLPFMPNEPVAAPTLTDPKNPAAKVPAKPKAEAPAGQRLKP